MPCARVVKKKKNASPQKENSMRHLLTAQWNFSVNGDLLTINVTAFKYTGFFTFSYSVFLKLGDLLIYVADVEIIFIP